MSGLEIPDAYERAEDKPAFSNGTMWEIWSYNNCYQCVNDGMGIGEDDPQCPLILVALCGRTPAEWTDQNPPLGDFTCIYFRDRDDPGGREPEPVPDPPGQLELFPRDQYTAPGRMWAATPERETVPT